MYDMHDKLNQYYENHVRLGKEKDTLRKHRECNLERLKAGLESLEYPSDFNSFNQGSMAMNTINQHPDKDYDIDVAVIFPKESLPSSAYNSRKRIEAAMQEGGGNFSHPPEAKTNAVRVYYAEGYHIDLAIYRKYEDWNGKTVFEHAGLDWSQRDPNAVTSWFNEAVGRLSPKTENGATVESGQLRRIVRFLKAFAKSRKNWNLPGGLIISILAQELYQADYVRDDVSLFKTMEAIRNRLQYNQEVKNPVNGESLCNRDKDKARINNFKDKLDMAIDKLGVLHNWDCTEDQAYSAWHWVFQHVFWSKDENAESFDDMGKKLGKAAIERSIYISGTGGISTEGPNTSYVQAKPQRFYGDD